MLLAVGIAADLSARREQLLLLGLQILRLRVVILDLVQDQLLLVLLGSRDTFDIRVLLFPTEKLLLPPKHKLPLTLGLRHLHDFLLLLCCLLYLIYALHLNPF